MKLSLTVLFAMLISGSVCAQINTDILHYRFAIELTDLTDTINGTAHVTLVTKTPGRSVTLDLQGLSTKGKGMIVTKSVFPFVENGNDNAPVSRFTHQQNKLTIDALQPFNAGDTLELLVQYKGIPENGLIISKNMYGHRTFFGDNWPNRAHHWIPCVDQPGDKASFEFLVTAPDHYQVVSNGMQIEETSLSSHKKLTHWREDIPLPTKVMVIGVADFAVQHAGFVNNCIPVSSWVFPENADKGFYDYRIGTEVLAFFDQYIGPYPYRKLANVQSKTVYGGMENAGAIFYYENSVTGQRSEEGLFAHEIVHQWFGDMATEKSFAHLWLSEGFATYLTHIYLESKYGTDSLHKRMQEDRLSVLSFVKESKRPVVDSTPNYLSLLNANSYQKGSWILHMLRRELGDSLFHTGVRRYYDQYKGGNAETRDLQAVFEKLSGKSLETFFRQWLFRGVNPQLAISWKKDPMMDGLIITIDQVQKGLPFEMALEMELHYEGNIKEVRRFDLSKATHSFLITGKGKLLNVIPDPNTSILAGFSILSGN
jgi:aminopeptidase N